MKNIPTKSWRYRRIYGIVIFILFIALASITAISRSTGITGRTSQTDTGCYCHGSSSAATTVSVSSSSGVFEMEPGSENSFTVTVSNSAKNAAGVDIAVKTSETGNTDAGSLSVQSGTGLQVSNGEVTHTTPKSMSGGQASFNFTWTAPADHGTYYLRAAGNAVDNGGSNSNDQWNFMPVKVLTVKGATVSSPNGSEEWCLGSSHNITWTQTGLQNVKIELSSDGGSSFPIVITQGTPAAGGSFQWSIPTDLTPGSQYKIKISDANSSSNYDISNQNFALAGQTAITSHPQNITGCTGTPVTFSVSATGAGLSYRWRKNGQPIGNATLSTYSIPNPVLADAGSYDVVVTGTCGAAVTSNQATLTLDESPSISQDPVSKAECIGSNVTFSVAASGTDINFEWRKNGTKIDNANQATLELTNIQPGDAGSYTAIISGKCNPAKTSKAATLTVYQPPQITGHPQSATVCEGSKASLFVNASGSNLSYIWIKNGTDIPNSNSATFTIDKVTPADAGTYEVVVSGVCTPSQTSSQAVLSVNKLPEVTQNPSDVTVNEGGALNLSIKATGDISKYQWRKDSKSLLGFNQASLSIKAVTLQDAGSYDCIVTNACGNDTSKASKVVVNPAGPGASLSLALVSVDFGQVLINSAKDSTCTELITNIGNEPLTVTAISVSGNDNSSFKLGEISLPFTLQKNEKKSLHISFIPTSGGNKTAIVKFTSNASFNPTLDLIGFGAIMDISPSALLVDFGAINADSISTRILTINNAGNLPVSVSTWDISGLGADAFTITDDLSNKVIQPKDKLDFAVKFVPKEQKNYESDLKLNFKETTIEVNIKLQGNGVVSSVEDYGMIESIIAWPNPFSGEVAIQTELRYPGAYSVEIINIMGQKVNEYKINASNPGNYKINWDGKDSSGIQMPGGSYNIVIRNDSEVKYQTIMLVR